MKAITLSLCILLLFACASADRTGIKEFMPGTYIRYAKHEFGKEWDTLTIAVQNPSANQYSILRRWRYERVMDGRAVEPEYKTRLTSGVLHVDKEGLLEQETNKLLTFNEVQGVMLVGTTEYRKLK